MILLTLLIEQDKIVVDLWRLTTFFKTQEAFYLYSDFFPLQDRMISLVVSLVVYIVARKQIFGYHTTVKSTNAKIYH